MRNRLVQIITLGLAVTVLCRPPATAAETAKIPPEKELRALALDSLLAFDQAIQAKDFTDFHGKISEVWRKQITPEKLQDIFQSFIEQEIDLSLVAKVAPAFDKPPKIDDDGVLILEGHYPTLPNKIDFRLKYLNEKGGWKLLGVKVDVAPDAASVGKMPSEKETVSLVQDSLGAFDRAIRAKNFTAFHKQIAAAWQSQTTPDKLQGLFQSFIDQEIDLAPISKLEPIFDEPPAINESGLLELKGSFPTKPSKVRFHLAYLYEAPAWKLVKINVKVGADEPTDD